MNTTVIEDEEENDNDYDLQIDTNIIPILVYPLTNNIRIEYLSKDNIWQANNEDIDEILEIDLDFSITNLWDEYELKIEEFTTIKKIFYSYLKIPY